MVSDYFYLNMIYLCSVLTKVTCAYYWYNVLIRLRLKQTIFCFCVLSFIIINLYYIRNQKQLNLKQQLLQRYNKLGK